VSTYPLSIACSEVTNTLAYFGYGSDKHSGLFQFRNNCNEKHFNRLKEENGFLRNEEKSELLSRALISLSMAVDDISNDW